MVGTIILLLTILLSFTTFTQAFALNDNDNILSPYINLLEDKIIDECKYLYGANGSIEYLYCDFENGGYIILQMDTMEPLEYSLDGVGPYSDVQGNLYYDGPFNYYKQIDNEYVDLSLYDGFSNQEGSAPSIDKNELISAISPSLQNEGYVPNAQYFLSDPMFGENRHNTCGSVAVQLLLGYNNYSYVIELNIEDYRTVDILDLKFSAHGSFSDDWQFNNFRMNVKLTN